MILYKDVITKERLQLLGMTVWILGAYISFMHINWATNDKRKESPEERKKRLRLFKKWLFVSFVGLVVTAMNVSG
jgi:hypothetical protein